MTEQPTQLPVTEEVTEQPEALPDTKSIIGIEMPDANSVNAQLTLRNVSPMQLWAAARLLETYGDSLYASQQMQAQMEARKAANGASPQDHKPKRKKGAN